ncbi:RNA-splicing ligase RtcB [Halobacteriales archaeon QH_2_65_14]|nr:MAG: RNA-splicing ligase RtcB [Halobacteriales archaeon QH_2_65_14]
MTETFDAGTVTLERVREYVWEIPREGDMRVPARVLASKSLLEEIKQDKTLQQLKNTTHLPGIQKYAVALPDSHQGYGFPVGGVAGIDAENGCISPGAVGYDINCLPAETDVSLSFGRRIPLGDLRDRFERESAMVAGDELTDSSIRLFTESGRKPVYEVETATGESIEATADHPFLTPEGMVELDDLEPGDTVYVQPFRGLEHEEPADVTLLTEEDFADQNHQIRRVLRERDVLPLSTADETFNHLLKLLGFFTGDGSFGGDGQTWFYGDPEDLEGIREDIRKIGFKPSRIYSRDRNHETDGKTFETTEYSFKTTSKAFRLLLGKLGAPVGAKISAGFETPECFEHLTNWQKALYYSAYFGAEMNAPAAQHDKNLYCPKVSHSRSVETVDAGRRFLEDLQKFFADVGIETTTIEQFGTDTKSDTDVVRLRLGVKSDTESLLRFFSTVGYRYNREKQRKAVKAIQYLKTKEREIERREQIASEARTLADGGVQAQDVKDEFDINERFGERSRWSGRSDHPRPGEKFCADCDVAENMTVGTELVAIEEAGEKPVYDIGVEHSAHNFIAEEFVVSNCGVRMMKTNLKYYELSGREEELVNALFANVPSGLGGGGIVESAPVEEILERGVEWAVEEGHGVESDLAHCEDEGFRPEADATKVSKKAKDRGRNQAGSLGSGNHFLEVQRVTDVYREDVADEFGLEEEQIVVLIHCGSRGLGHQVCTDYLRDIEETHQGLLNQLPDKELAAAPAGSQLAEDYYAAMCAAINFAWVNRQLIMHRTRRVFEKVFDRSWQDMEMKLLYDVAHNIAKKEVHEVRVGPEGRPAGDGEAVDGEEMEVYVHRKGATRAFPAGRPEVPPAYRDVGQPIIIPGSMGAGSYVLRGGEQSMSETFGSTAHGAGRLMSRTQAKNEYWGEDVMDDLREQNHIYVKAQSGATVAEEAPGVYKDVDEVVRVSDALGVGDRVARTYPVCNIKG